ncbi:LysR substrate-binding domain-containing protein [Paucibacter sp. APW11]|uniref:LysR substrate-binding domain-containing protein n=1 Tax=Roseateles aquae TaxID=3077235 RepID=A0ABU3PII1_9BURK|nr:LysR substrate-binding domain-containing protein [Paucibacter sp. APW11]MDT9001918.1 LysR substrate-binding domain-containing protein [Paucibacter sp. APW11]
MLDFPLDLLRAFDAVASHRSFARAALDLRLSASALSRQIKQLERHLGMPLFYRSTRSMALTEAGQTYLEATREALAQLRTAGQALGRLQGEVRGELRLGAPVAYGRRFVVPLLPDFMRNHPAVTLSLQMSDRYADLAAEGLDLAIRVGRLEDSGLRSRQLAESRRVLVASPDYLAARGTPASLQELKRHSCLALTVNRDGEPWRCLDRSGELHSIKPTGRLRADNGDAVLAFALAGCGIAFLSDLMVAEALAQGRLCRVLPDCAGPAHGVHAVFLADPEGSPKLRALLDFLVLRLAGTQGRAR